MKVLSFLVFLMMGTISSLILIDSSSRTITGIVTSDGGEALIGANIVVRGTTTGTVTDIDGSYSIEMPEGHNKLFFSFTGYQSEEITVSELDSIVNVSLSVVEFLSEVVVTGLSRKRSPKGSRASLKTVGQQLQGIATGVTVRGMSSVSAYQDSEYFNTEDYDHIVENKFYNPKNTPLSTFSIDVDAASYSNMRRYVNQGQTPPKDAIRIEEMINYFDYDYPDLSDEVPFTVRTELSECPWNKKNQLLHIGIQGKKMEQENLPPSNLVFLIDVSGSMSAPNKLGLVKSSLNLLVNQMREEDRVSIVTYAGSSGLVLPPTSGAEKDKIVNALGRLESGGSTAGAQGIKLAYETAKEHFMKNGNNRVILATDGDFNVGVSSDGELVRIIEKERKSGVFLSVLGFGMGNYKDNKMQKLADHGNGNHSYIDNIMEAKKVFVNEFGGTLFTIAKDVKLQLEFNPENVKGYRLIGYENRMLDKEDFNNDKKDAGEIGAGHTVTTLYEIAPMRRKSKEVSSVDELRYQETTVIGAKAHNDELMCLKIRYKQPNGSKSHLISQSVSSQEISLDDTSENFRWSAAVAEFGLLLRDSDYKKNATYGKVMRLAKGAEGNDQFGYRDEFIRLVESMELLAVNLFIEGIG